MALRTKAHEEGPKSAANAFKAIDNKLKLPGGGCSESIGYMEQHPHQKEMVGD